MNAKQLSRVWVAGGSRKGGHNLVQKQSLSAVEVGRKEPQGEDRFQDKNSWAALQISLVLNENLLLRAVKLEPPVLKAPTDTPQPPKPSSSVAKSTSGHSSLASPGAYSACSGQTL